MYYCRMSPRCEVDRCVVNDGPLPTRLVSTALHCAAPRNSHDLAWPPIAQPSDSLSLPILVRLECDQRAPSNRHSTTPVGSGIALYESMFHLSGLGKDLLVICVSSTMSWCGERGCCESCTVRGNDSLLHSCGE